MTPVAATVWNFILTGDVRSGAGVVLGSINGRSDTICHAGLFQARPEARRAAHEGYFGASFDGVPAYYVENETSPWRYINHTVLDNPQRGEQAVGFHLAYPEVCKLEIYDLIEERYRSGNFSLIHVHRNPVACLISLKQAAQGIQHRCPSPLKLDPQELIAFCREHETTKQKLNTACADCLNIEYQDLVFDYQGEIQRVFDFIEVPSLPTLAAPRGTRPPNKPIRDRVVNWAELYSVLPSDVKRLVDSPSLF